MSTSFSCPHCRTDLLLPAGCEGQTTRCPECSQSFVIPRAAPAAVATPVRAVAAKAPPAVEQPASEEDRRRAKEAFERLTAENVGLQVELARRERVWRALDRRLVWLERFRAGRNKLDESIGRAGGFFVGMALGAAGAMLLVSVFSPSALTYFAAAVLGLCAAGVVYLPFSFFPDDAKLALLIPRLQAELADAAKRHDALAAEEARQREQLARAEQAHTQVKSALASRVAWLRTCQWEQMNGPSFVNFLKQVFEEHGYTIEPTGKKGSAGVDLVVVRDRTRTAVVARGTQMPTIDARTVEQALAGKKWYKCQAAAVVTNGNVMPSAQQLADRAGCQVIDARRIPELIEGALLV